MYLVKTSLDFLLIFFCVVFYWTLKIYCICILHIFLISFKMLKLVIISVL